MNGLKVQDFHGKQVIDNLPLLEECVKNLVEIAFVNPRAAVDLVDLSFSGIDAPWIEFCVRTTLIDLLAKSFPTEQDVYEWFRSHYQNIVGDGWTIVKRKNDPKHIPDFWLSDGEDFVPVECKLMEFDNKALKQLQRYMEFYKSSNGIAVAKTCTCNLPPNIRFIAFNYSDIKINEEGKRGGNKV